MLEMMEVGKVHKSHRLTLEPSKMRLRLMSFLRILARYIGGLL